LCYWLRKKTRLQGIIDRLIETGRCYGMEMNVGKTKAMKISRKPPSLQITVDQKELENLEYFDHLGAR
jgi:hypothetical protein